jgi:sensor histidine kinase YesM
MKLASIPINAKTELRDLGIMMLISIPMSLINCTNCYDNFWQNPKPGIFGFVVNLGYWIILWKGNGALNWVLDQKISWIRFPVKRFVAGLIVLFVYSIPAIYLFGHFIFWIFGYNYSLTNLKFTITIAISITIVISLFLNGRAFLLSWRKSALAEEKLRSEKIMAQYEALKNQVNPHFLFNSLNVLSSLIEIDPRKASQYVQQLSDIMRYVLESRKRDLVPLKEELDFIRHFLHLQKLRFGGALNYKIDIEDQNNGQIVPLALQLLVENAIKHNVITQEQPLTIFIKKNGKRIFVVNDLQTKTQLSSGSGVGLTNLKERYQFLSDQAVDIKRNDQQFSVCIPIIDEPKSL